MGRFSITKQRLACYMYSITATLVMFINGYDASVFNNIMNWKTWNDKFNNPPNNNLIGAVNSSTMVANIVFGFFVSPYISDRFGRRMSIFIGCVIIIIAAIIELVAPNIGGFIGGRVIIGMGGGISMAAGPTFMSEITPHDIRGRMLSFWQIAYSVGALVCTYIALGTSYYEYLGMWQWGTPILLQCMAPALCCCLIFFCPESPRWLVQKGRDEDARKALLRIREPEEVESELQGIKDAIKWEQENTTQSFRDLFVTASMRRRLIVGLVINFGQQVTGQAMMTQYSSRVYTKIFTSQSTITLINALNYTFGILFTLPATFLSDRLGRRALFIVGGTGQAVTLIIAATVMLTVPQPNGYPSQAVGAGVVLVMFLFTASYKPTWGATTWIYTSEMFPMNVRAVAVAVCSNTQNVAGAILAQAFPPMFATMGFKSFYVWVACNVVLVTFVYFMCPETKGLALEDIDVIFGSAAHDIEVGSYENEKPASIKVDEKEEKINY
ncbi:sugar transporter [Umbelopsis sp. PMI_123]|nr:sugar transporter [Umbelopsis sp. PMI_123]